eukprot:5427611-Pleurochrysis_carterae.AAC.3
MTSARTMRRASKTVTLQPKRSTEGARVERVVQVCAECVAGRTSVLSERFTPARCVKLQCADSHAGTQTRARDARGCCALPAPTRLAGLASSRKCPATRRGWRRRRACTKGRSTARPGDQNVKAAVETAVGGGVAAEGRYEVDVNTMIQAALLKETARKDATFNT